MNRLISIRVKTQQDKANIYGKFVRDIGSPSCLGLIMASSQAATGYNLRKSFQCSLQ